MSFEKRWASVAPRLFTADGTDGGKITLADTIFFKVKQKVAIQASGEPNLELEVKAVLSPTVLIVGPLNGNIQSKSNISAYTTAKGSFIYAQEQLRSEIPEVEHFRATFEEEPTNARRSVLVDPYGNFYTPENPLPVQVDLVLENVQVNVELDAFEEEDPDSVLIVGSEDGTVTGIKHVVKVEPGGEVNVIRADLRTPFITNIPVAVANTETTVPIPSGTRAFTIRVRGGNAKGQISYISGQTATEFITLEYGNSYKEENLKLNAILNLYIQLNKSSQVLELLTWT